MTFTNKTGLNFTNQFILAKQCQVVGDKQKITKSGF